MEETPMSVSAISSVVPTTNVQQLQKAVPAPAASKPSGSSSPADTVSLSPAAQKASQTGDVDRDGDSH
jgi:hypothetical protein